MWVSETDENEGKGRDTQTEIKTVRGKVDRGLFEEKQIAKVKRERKGEKERGKEKTNEIGTKRKKKEGQWEGQTQEIHKDRNKGREKVSNYTKIETESKKNEKEKWINRKKGKKMMKSSS